MTNLKTSSSLNTRKWQRLLLLAAALFSPLALSAQSEPEEIQELDIFEVRALAEGQRRALLEQRDSRNFINVVSADAVGRFPDPNIAEALQRLPGISIERDQGEGRYINVRGAPKEFASITIDGINIPASDVDTRAVDLDVFASDFVQQIQVTKAVRPDQDADAIAGSVNIQTPSALNIGRRFLSTAALSYNDFGGTNDNRFSFLYTDVFGDRDQWGLVLGFNYSKTRRELDNIEHEGWEKWTVGSGADEREVWVFEETNFKDYETRRTRQGLNGALEYQLSDTSRFFLRGFTSKFEDNEYRYRLRITWWDGTLDETTATDGFATWTRPWVSYQFRERIKIDESSSVSAGGVHTYDNLEFDYTLAYSRAEQPYPRRDELLFRIRVPSITYDFRDNFKLPFISLFETNEHLNTDGYQFREYARRTLFGAENELMGSANLRLFQELFNAPATHSFGVKIRDRDKFYDFDRFRDRRASSAPAQNLTALLRDTPADNFGYFLGNKHQPDLVKEYYDIVRPNAPQRNLADGILSDYDVEEQIAAAYAMSEFTISGIDVIAGLRVERTRTEATGFTLDRSTNEVGTDTVSNSNTNFFPGLHGRYELTPDLILRGSFTRGISRAPIGALAPTRDLDPDSRTLSLGNPDLNPTLANNYDLSLEYYLGTSGIFSVAGFYKDLKDYVVRARFNGLVEDDGVQQTFRITQPLNSPDGYLYGIELSYQQTLDFLPDPFDGLGLFANFTYTESEATLPDGSGKVVLPGQSRRTANVGIYFETNRFSSQISWSERSRYIQTLDTINGREYDVYWGGVGQLDLTLSYQATRNMEIFAEFNNLNNGKGYRYVGSPERVLEYEEFGWWVTYGLKFNF